MSGDPAVAKEFIVSGDSHTNEPPLLFKERLPVNMRADAHWEEETILEDPLVPGGHTEFRTAHTPGYEGWTVSRFRQFPGPTPDGLATSVIRDLDRDGVDATVFFPNWSMFATFTDNHERSLAHAKVYNDWIVEEYGAYSNRIVPAASIPTTNGRDAAKEIDRVANNGVRALVLPEHPQPHPYWHSDYEPIWDAAAANGLPIFFHVASGGVNEAEGTSITGDNVKGVMAAMTMGKQESLNGAMLAGRTMGGGNTGAMSPMRIIADLVSAGVCERHPELMFNMIEFNAGWLANYMGMMDKSWRIGTGMDPHWWIGFWDPGVDPHDQKLMGRIFKINDRWPHPLKPSEYVKRNIRVQFADDRVAVLSRHITGVDTIYWGSDYPHAEGTFLGSQQVIEEQFEGVPDEDRAKMLGLTLGNMLGLDTSKKLAPVNPPTEAPIPVLA
jgi:predicted TIM-barrel fold metal-dependent hydrolase